MKNELFQKILYDVKIMLFVINEIEISVPVMEKTPKQKTRIVNLVMGELQNVFDRSSSPSQTKNLASMSSLAEFGPSSSRADSQKLFSGNLARCSYSSADLALSPSELDSSKQSFGSDSGSGVVRQLFEDDDDSNDSFYDFFFMGSSFGVKKKRLD